MPPLYLIRALCAFAVLLALASLPAQAAATASPGAPAPAGSLDPLLFESRNAGHNSGAAAISQLVFPGHSFRLEERAHITALGAYLSSTTPGSVFAALYRIGPHDAAPGVLDESGLVAATLLEADGNGAADVYGAVDVVVEPGWYAIVVGIGRHGASAGPLQVSMPSAGSQGTPQSWGPYSVNTTTGAANLNASRTRFMVHGTLLPPLPLPADRFLHETARPWAWWDGYLEAIGDGESLAVRFSLDRTTHIERVDTWLYRISGSVHAAIFPLASANAPLPDPQHPDYAAQAVASGLLHGEPGWPDEYGVELDVLLPPGDYALVLGSDQFGASGTAAAMAIDDHVVVPGLDRYNGSHWVRWNTTTISVRLSGRLPPLVADPRQLDFGTLLVGDEATLEAQLHNQGVDAASLVGLQLTGPDASQFELAGDSIPCQPLPAGASCTLEVQYHPAAPGPHAAQLLLDTGTEVLEVALAGDALAWAWVTPQVQGNGVIVPGEPQRAVLGEPLQFQLQPGTGHHLANVLGNCDGSLVGHTYTTQPITGDCTIQAVFAINTYQVAASAGDHGSISPAGELTVEHGQRPVFTIDADPGYHLAGIQGSCQGVLDGNQYTLAPVAGDCSLHASFALNPATQLEVVAGAGQSARINQPFDQPLVVAVRNDAGLPVPGTLVSFHAPSDGPGASLPAQASSDGAGLVTVAASANHLPGSYQVHASADGIETMAAFPLTNLPPAVTLGLSIDNGLEHLAYGAQGEWLVTLENTGKDPASGATVLLPVPAQLDAEAVRWTCLDPASGCTPAGSGSLDDQGLQLPAAGQVQYLLSGPVRSDSADAEVVLVGYADADHHAPVGASDRTWLVLFRDGFQAGPDGGAEVAPAGR